MSLPPPISWNEWLKQAEEWKRVGFEVIEWVHPPLYRPYDRSYFRDYFYSLLSERNAPFSDYIKNHVVAWSGKEPDPERDIIGNVDFWNNHFTIWERKCAFVALKGPFKAVAFCEVEGVKGSDIQVFNVDEKTILLFHQKGKYKIIAGVGKTLLEEYWIDIVGASPLIVVGSVIGANEIKKLIKI